MFGIVLVPITHLSEKKRSKSGLFSDSNEIKLPVGLTYDHCPFYLCPLCKTYLNRGLIISFCKTNMSCEYGYLLHKPDYSQLFNNSKSFL